MLSLTLLALWSDFVGHTHSSSPTHITPFFLSSTRFSYTCTFYYLEARRRKQEVFHPHLQPLYRYIKKGPKDINKPVHSPLTFTLCRKHRPARSGLPFAHHHQSQDRSVMFQKGFLIICSMTLKSPCSQILLW